jgi:hypothetical protein
MLALVHGYSWHFQAGRRWTACIGFFLPAAVASLGFLAGVAVALWNLIAEGLG